jgi:hypothetical protein
VKVCQFLVAVSPRIKADVTSMDRCRRLPGAALSWSSTHPLRCSRGRTPLKVAITSNKSDVAAFLRSVGAPE